MSYASPMSTHTISDGDGGGGGGGRHAAVVVCRIPATDASMKSAAAVRGEGGDDHVAADHRDTFVYGA